MFSMEISEKKNHHSKYKNNLMNFAFQITSISLKLKELWPWEVEKKPDEVDLT